MRRDNATQDIEAIYSFLLQENVYIIIYIIHQSCFLLHMNLQTFWHYIAGTEKS